MPTNLYYPKADFGYYLCVPCVNGVTNMTLKLTFRTSSGDPNEWIRVRAGGLGGAVLYDSKTDALPGDGLPVGTVFSFDVPASATQVVVTVQGLNHASETVKSTFSAECNLVIGTENGNTYIKFKVMDAKLDGSLLCAAPPPTGKIGDRVWLDADGDGVQDSGETGINGVTVKLLNASGAVVGTQVTAGDGGYLFTGLAGGAYSVVVDAATLPAGLTQTFDADGVSTANQSSLSLAAGASNLDQDFGYRYNGKIGDRVWLDADGDGVQDSGETGINGVTVKLLNASSAVVDTQVTAGDGGYLFTGLAAGNYSVVVDAATLPAGLTQTFDADGLSSANKSSLSLAAGASNLNQDFGYKPAGACVPCVNGVTNMTLKLTFRTSSGDPNEWIRVRAGGLGGAVLYDSKTDALPGDGLPVGTVFSFDVPASATQVVVTVQGLNHASETVKSTFSAECNLVIGTENGNDYIKFKVMDAKFDGSLHVRGRR